MGNSCGCYNDKETKKGEVLFRTPEQSIRDIQASDKIWLVVKIQAHMRAFLARKKVNHLKVEKTKGLFGDHSVAGATPFHSDVVIKI